jgi:hypothetical protein
MECRPRRCGGGSSGTRAQGLVGLAREERADRGHSRGLSKEEIELIEGLSSPPTASAVDSSVSKGVLGGQGAGMEGAER